MGGIRTQKDRKLQTLIEVCTDFASLSPSINIHRPGEQTFAVEEDQGSEMFAMMDRSWWTGQGVSEPTIPPSLAHIFALARSMEYEMRPVARRSSQPPGSPREPFTSGQGYRQPFRQARDFSKVKCFSCGQSRIRRYHSNRWVGTCSQMDSNRESLIHHRETPFRPGPHPNRSECHSSGPQFIFINRLIWTDIICGLISFNYTSHCGFRRRAGCTVWES